MTRCELCKKETDILLTIEKRKKEYLVCRECLEKCIYQERRKTYKKIKKYDRSKKWEKKK